jgi:HAD superfamily hydrolase (TIGR01484 family)
MKKLIAFDLDGTLAPSKSPAPDRMTLALDRLLDTFHVCVISGGKFEQFEKQLLGNLKSEPKKLERLHIMPTCGTRYYRFNPSSSEWSQVYTEDFTEAQKKKIIEVVDEAARELGYDKSEAWGERIEDRGSQISWSALGQEVVTELGEEGVLKKEEWDPDSSKKRAMQEYIAPRLLEFEVRMGGGTTIDITKLGIDKAYGMQKLMELLKIGKEDILFIGDRLQEGGNDYPVKAMGIDSLEISAWQETALAIEAILHVV